MALFIIILLSSFSVLPHQVSGSQPSFIPLFFLVPTRLLGTYSAPGTEDAVMLKTWPSWNLDGGWKGGPRSTINGIKTGQADNRHKEKHSRARALWVLYWERDTPLRCICLWKGHGLGNAHWAPPLPGQRLPSLFPLWGKRALRFLTIRMSTRTPPLCDRVMDIAEKELKFKS